LARIRAGDFDINVAVVSTQAPNAIFSEAFRDWSFDGSLKLDEDGMLTTGKGVVSQNKNWTLTSPVVPRAENTGPTANSVLSDFRWRSKNL
jgi:hypothetical protein